MRLSKPAILRLIASGDVIIDPFDARNLKSAQYDVSIGPHCYREVLPDSPRSRDAVYNPYDARHVARKWRPDRAVRHANLVATKILPESLENVGPDEEVILISPGEMILAHTLEFIGGRGRTVTTTMHARSTIGRSFLEIARCAGVGDVGYFTRWTLEVVNTSRYHRIPLVVGRRVGQVMFHQVEQVAAEDVYSFDGKYQTSSSLEEIKARWRPEMMLPRMYLDRECRERGSRLSDDQVLNELAEQVRRLYVAPGRAPTREERVSFAYGNCKISNQNVTREMVERAVDLVDWEKRKGGSQ